MLELVVCHVDLDGQVPSNKLPQMLTLFDHITLEENKLQMLELVIFRVDLEGQVSTNKLPCSKQKARERLVLNVDLFVSKKRIDARNC